MKSFLVNLLTLGVVVHLTIGCCWHHRHATEMCAGLGCDHRSTTAVFPASASQTAGHHACDCSLAMASTFSVDETNKRFKDARIMASVTHGCLPAHDTCHDDHCQGMRVSSFAFRLNTCVVAWQRSDLGCGTANKGLHGISTNASLGQRLGQRSGDRSARNGASAALAAWDASLRAHLFNGVLIL